MAVNDEVYRLILETIGTEGIGQLRSAIGQTKAAMGELKDAYERGEVSQTDYFRGVEQLARVSAKLESTIRGVERAEHEKAQADQAIVQGANQAAGALERQSTAADHAANSLERIGKTVGRSGNTGLAVLQGAQLMDDLQYGIRGVVNNVATR